MATPNWPCASTTWASCCRRGASTARRSRISATPWRCRKRLYPRRQVSRRTPRPGQKPQQPGRPAAAAGGVRQGGAVLPRRPGDVQTPYPPAKYPDGHPDLATKPQQPGRAAGGPRGVRQGGAVLPRRPGDESASTRRTSTPTATPTWPSSLNNLGFLLEARGSTARRSRSTAMSWICASASTRPPSTPTATPIWQRASATWVICRRPAASTAKAEPLLRDALDMYRRLYPLARFPCGHPDLAGSLNNLGTLLKERGEYGKAVGLLAQGAAMYDSLNIAFAEKGAEAEALNLADNHAQNTLCIPRRFLPRGGCRPSPRLRRAVALQGRHRPRPGAAPPSAPRRRSLRWEDPRQARGTPGRQ